MHLTLIRILNIQICDDRPYFETGGFKRFQQTAINNDLRGDEEISNM